MPDTASADIRFRRASPADALALSAFAAQAFADAFGPQNRAEDMDAHMREHYTAEKFDALLCDPDVTTLLVVRDEVIVGYAQLRGGEPPACVTMRPAIEIQRFYVDRSLHGTGVAHRVMAEALASAAARGASYVWLGVWELNPRAIAFYRKHDFVDVGSKAYVVGTDHQTDRVLVKALTRAL